MLNNSWGKKEEEEENKIEEKKTHTLTTHLQLDVSLCFVHD